MNARSALVAALCGVVVFVAAVEATSAHDATGAIEIIDSEQVGASVRYEVSITYDNDGHGAADATATVVAEFDGLTVGPVPLEPSEPEGAYAATLNFPRGGMWTIRFSSLTPTAILEFVDSIDIAPAATTSLPSRTTSPATTTTTTTRSTTVAVSPITVAPSTAVSVTTAPVVTTSVGPPGADGGGATGTIVVLVAVSVVMVIGAALWWGPKRKRSR